MIDRTEIVLAPFGFVELVQIRKVENGVLHVGGYSIRLDRDGKEISRTEPQWYATLSVEGGEVDINGDIVGSPWWKFWA